MTTPSEIIARAFERAGVSKAGAWAETRDLLAIIRAAGYVVVPMEPTAEMIEAGQCALPAGHGQAWMYVDDCYKAMLAAAEEK